MFGGISFLEQINYVRVGGSKEEKKAARYISDVMASLGAVASIETFDVQSFTEGKATLEVLEPYRAKYEGFPVGFTGSHNFTANLIPRPSDVESESDAKGKILLVTQRVNYKRYKHLANIGASGFIMLNPPGKKPQYTTASWEAVDRFGEIAGLSLPYEAGREMVKRGAKKVHIKIDQKSQKSQSQNIIGEIPGRNPREKSIIVCGHYDSVGTSPGMIDNAAGIAALLTLLEKFAKKPARRTIKFIAFGSEELGLRGSRAFVEAHKNELENIAFVLNLDIAGDVLGLNFAKVTGGRDIEEYLSAWAKIQGYQLKAEQSIYSSDNMPFCRMGIPAVSLGRGGLSGFYVHSSEDTIDNVDRASILQTSELSERFLRDISEAPVFPFKRDIPDNVKKDIEKYFGERWNVKMPG